MGAGNSPPVLVLTTSQDRYQSGHSVSGEIQLTLHQETEIDDLEFTLKEREKMRMEPFPLCGIAESHAFYRVAYSIKVPRFQSGVRRPGVHLYPFIFQIPQKSSGSFLYSESVKTCRYVYLRYTLIAKIKHPSLKSKLEIHISPPKPELKLPYELSAAVFCPTCGLNNELEMQIVLDKSAYSPGETIHLALLIKPTEIREFQGKIKLCRDLTASSGAIAFSTHEKVGKSRKVSKVLSPLQAEVMDYLLTVTEKLKGTPTLHSRFITCEYYVRLDVLARGKCGVLKRSTKVPISIFCN